MTLILVHQVLKHWYLYIILQIILLRAIIANIKGSWQWQL